MSLAARELIVVHGKGGVGRTTVTAALTLALARAGRRAVAVELGGQRALAEALGFSEGAYAPRQVAERASVRSLSVTDCLSDFGQRKLRIKALARWFFESRLMTGFVESVPGLTDVVQLGKLEDMLRHPLEGEPVWDVAVLDAPATGHGLTLVGAARSMAQLTRVGPFYDLATIIEGFLSEEAAVAHLMVTLPEELPVSESLELAEALAADHVAPRAAVLNRVGPPEPAGAQALLSALEAEGGAAAEALARLAREELARARREARARGQLELGLAGLSEGSDAPVVPLPQLAQGPAGPEALAPLVEALGPVLEAL